jgi:hypothetical protein
MIDTQHIPLQKLYKSLGSKPLSGTVVSFELPLGVTELLMLFEGVTSPTTNQIIQLGDSTGRIVTGYTSIFGNRTGSTAFTAGFGISNQGAVIKGYWYGIRFGATRWIAAGHTNRTTHFADTHVGTVNLSGPVQSIHYTTVSGDALTTGTITVLYR